MSRKFIASVAFVALTIAAIGNAPARADEDLARALAAAVGVAIVGKVLTDRLRQNDRTDLDDIATRRYGAPVWQDSSISPRDDRVIRSIEPRPLPRDVRRSLLPQECLRSFETREGRYRVFGKKCLKKNYAYARSLPSACAVKFRAQNKTRQGYDARCLRRAGYQLARR